MGLTALAGALRFLGLGDIPPGLYRDEAFNGLDALRVLDGSLPIYFPANHGREPLFLYLIAATVGALGRTPVAIRLAAALCGTLTIPATYVMAQAWFDRRIALLSAAVLSVMVWHIQLSRVGFRAVMLPLATALLLWSGARAFRSRRARAWLLTGILYGLTFYTYVAAQFTPVVLLGLAVYLFLVGRASALWPDALYFGIGALVALTPLGVYAALHWGVVMGRPSQVSILNPAVNQGDLWGTLGRHIMRTLGLFFVRGDPIPRHNVPGRPVFTPLMGAAMVLGTARAAALARRRDVGSATILIWVGAMLVPTLAAADAPHFLRAVGVLPLVAILPALGLDVGWRALAGRNLGTWGSVLLCLVLAFSLGATVRDYFVQYGTSAEPSYAFEAAATELAAQVNGFTGVGWDGERSLAPPPTSNPHAGEERRVYLDMRLWQAWKALPFLVPEQKALTRFQPNSVPSMPPVDQSMLLLWPYDDLEPYLEVLPHPARIEARAGPLTRGDLEEQAYPAYASFHVRPLSEEKPLSLARFGESIELTDFAIDRGETAWEVRLMWHPRARPEADYTAFVYLCNGPCTADQRVAQDDASPGGPYYPTHLWRPGDIVVDVHTLRPERDWPVEPQIAVGLYSWPTLERLPVSTIAGPSQADMFTLPIRN